MIHLDREGSRCEPSLDLGGANFLYFSLREKYGDHRTTALRSEKRPHSEGRQAKSWQSRTQPSNQKVDVDHAGSGMCAQQLLAQSLAKLATQPTPAFIDSKAAKKSANGFLYRGLSLRQGDMSGKLKTRLSRRVARRR